MTKKLLMGNEAFAHAALEAGVAVVAGYPGTPSSELIETVAKRVQAGAAENVHVEWSTNEKAALELLAGASYAGARTLFTCKQVGLNVASDPLMSLNYVGVEGGCVIYVADGVSFVMADIPGIIEGASDGAGLGHDFLRHIDRCRLLVHLVDVSGSEGRDPVEDFEAINAELRAYSDVLASRTQIVAANKCDLLGDDRTNIDRLRAHVEAQGYEFFEMSAAAHTGTRELIQACAAKLAEIPPVPPYEADYVPPEPEVGTSDELQIRHFDDLWVVEGPWLQRLMGTINFGDYESRMYFDRVLRQSGLFDRLEAMGIEEGDTVSIYDLDFEFRF